MKLVSQIEYWAHMLDEAMQDKCMLTEGKHWPEDYKKTAFNTIKRSAIGQQSWYTDEYIKQDVETFAQEFGPLSHKNSNLGFFMTIIRWFVEHAGTSAQKYKEFIETKLDGIIRDLQTMLNDPKADRESMKRMSFAEFEKKQKDIADALKSADTDFSGEESADYDLMFIKSYEELHEKFGGNKTGYHGKSEWCHTNGKSTYESWTSNGTKFFFVLAKRGWEKTTPPDPGSTNAYDEYGISLIAILVQRNGDLLNATLRWNHIIEPAKAVPGTSVDRAFLTWKSLAETVKMDVKTRVLQMLKDNDVFSKYGKNIYNGLEGKCYVYDGHFIWTDINGNEIESPEKVSGDFDCNNCESLTSLKGAPQEVRGNFDCSGCKSLTSLEGAPQKVDGDFVCHDCTSLTSLEGAPQEVSRYFDCSGCQSLTSLEGAPQNVGGNFNCSRCESLASLDGAPQKVDGDFYCSNCVSLTSLEGAPQKVDGDFYCGRCKSLTSLEGAPQEVGGNFDCHYCISLSSLEGAPQKVDGDFDCSGCKSLTSLKGAPQEVGGYFDCNDCTSLTSLESAPQKVDGDFDCHDCTSLSSLEGAPQEVGGNFYCNGCQSLTSLEGAPQEVGGYFSCSGCRSLTSLEGAPQKVDGDFYYYGTKITSNRVEAYKAWLKTHPKENYHELAASD